MADAPRKKKAQRPVYINAGIVRPSSTADMTQGRGSEMPKGAGAAKGEGQGADYATSAAAAIVGYVPLEQTIRDRIEDPSRMTWDDFKQQHLDMSADAEKAMLEYRRQLDNEREARLRREDVGKKPKKDKKQKKGRKEHRHKKDKKRKDRKRSRRSDSGSGSDGSSDEGESDDDERRKRSRRAKERKEKERKRKDKKKRKKGGEAEGGGPVQLSKFFAQGGSGSDDSGSESG